MKTDKNPDIGIGDKIGQLSVLRLGTPNKWGHKTWTCLCDCGVEKDVLNHSLARGDVVSCGCYRKKMLHTRYLTHGHTISNNGKDSPEYEAWRGAHGRCRHAGNRAYKNYGGRGIKVCESWSGPKGFETFYQDMGPKPSPNHSLDRINVDGNYEPSNCRWATRSEQNLNKRPRFTIQEFSDETLLLELSRRGYRIALRAAA